MCTTNRVQDKPKLARAKSVSLLEGELPAFLGGPGYGRNQGKGSLLCWDIGHHYQRCTPEPAPPVNQYIINTIINNKNKVSHK